jgi:hypothetical protein
VTCIPCGFTEHRELVLKCLVDDDITIRLVRCSARAAALVFRLFRFVFWYHDVLKFWPHRTNIYYFCD